MTATYTFDVFASLDGFGSVGPGGDWGGYWGKQGPELLDHRLASSGPEQRMVFGATTFRQFVEMLAESTEDSDVRDPWGVCCVARDPGGGGRAGQRKLAGCVDLEPLAQTPIGRRLPGSGSRPR